MDKSDSFDENFSSSSDNNSNKLEDKIKEINNPFKYNNINRKNQKRATRVNSNTNLNLEKEDPSSRRNTGTGSRSGAGSPPRRTFPRGRRRRCAR